MTRISHDPIPTGDPLAFFVGLFNGCWMSLIICGMVLGIAVLLKGC